MDGQVNARSEHDDSDKRFENVCKKRPGNQDWRTDGKRHKFLTGTRCIVVHLKFER